MESVRTQKLFHTILAHRKSPIEKIRYLLLRAPVVKVEIRLT